jgi:hypothetical protein
MPMLIGDDIQLRQIVLNLLINASEGIGQRAPRIRVRSGTVESFERSGDQWVFFEVEGDRGTLAAEARARLLQPLASLSLTTGELALAATIKMVQGHGGVVELGEGHAGWDRVRVLLPVERDTDPRVRADTSNRDAGDEAAARPRNALVVVVSAETTLIAACQRAIELAGHRVQALRSRDEALIAVRAVVGDVRGVVVDATLEGDIDDTVARLRALTPTVPFLVIEAALTGGAAQASGAAVSVPLLEELAKLISSL